MTNPSQLTPLEELVFASKDYPWDEQAAATRLKETFGWAALAAYSLWADPLADPESADTYQLLVVDLVDAEPKIVPAALDAAAEKLSRMDEGVKDKIEDSLIILRERLARTNKTNEEPKTDSHEVAEFDTQASESNQEEPEAEAESQGNTQPEQQSSTDLQIKLSEAELLVDRLAREGRLLAAWGRDALTRFIAGLSDEPTISGEGYESVSPRAFFIRLIESLPALVPLTEIASPAAPQDNSLETLGRKIAQSLNR